MPKKYYRIVSREGAVRRARIFAGLTSEEMAQRIGLSRPMLSSIENGAGTSVKTAHKIARINANARNIFIIALSILSGLPSVTLPALSLPAMSLSPVPSMPRGMVEGRTLR